MEENEENLKTQQVPSFQSLKYEVESLFNQFISEDVKTNYEELEILLSKLLKELKVPLLFSQLDDQGFQTRILLFYLFFKKNRNLFTKIFSRI